MTDTPRDDEFVRLLQEARSRWHSRTLERVSDLVRLVNKDRVQLPPTLGDGHSAHYLHGKHDALMEVISMLVEERR